MVVDCSRLSTELPGDAEPDCRGRGVHPSAWPRAAVGGIRRAEIDLQRRPPRRFAPLPRSILTVLDTVGAGAPTKPVESTGEVCFTMAATPLVLVAAEDRAIRLLVGSAVRSAGLRVVHARGRPTEDQIEDLRPDVIVMEAEEPPGRAFAAVRELASYGRTPILLMSALATPTRVADGLDAGADDYIARPFDPAELAARVRSLVRRRRGWLHAGRRQIGSNVIDLESRSISRAGRSVALSREEWTLLTTLMQSEGRIIWRDELLTTAFGQASRDDVAQLRLSISRLRRKLGLLPWDDGPIRTIHGIGYAYDPQGLVPKASSGGLTDRSGTRPTARGARLAASASSLGRR